MAKTDIESINGHPIRDAKAREDAEKAMQAVSQLSTVKITATFEDGTTEIHTLYCKAVAE